jgi:hypothetical protein
MGGIDEYLNQPHKHYYEKNKLINDIQNVIHGSEYRGHTKHKGRISHIFEIEIQEDKTWLIVNEHDGIGLVFHGISDSKKVLKGIKK